MGKKKRVDSSSHHCQKRELYLREVRGKELKGGKSGNREPIGRPGCEHEARNACHVSVLPGRPAHIDGYFTQSW